MIGDILQPTHLLFILVIALIVLGPKRLPEVGRSLGRGLRDFRSALSGDELRSALSGDDSASVRESVQTQQAVATPSPTVPAHTTVPEQASSQPTAMPPVVTQPTAMPPAVPEPRAAAPEPEPVEHSG